MSALRTYLTALTALSLLLSLLQLLAPRGPLGEAASFVGGLILLLVLLQPMMGLDLSGQLPDPRRWHRAVEQRRGELEDSQREALKRRIEDGTESYISDKAQELGLALRVRVTAQAGEDGIPVPVLAELWGQRSEVLSRWMESALGLPAERQVWNED